MMNKYLQQIAIFMIVLVLTLPISFAASLKVTTISGDDKVDGLRRKVDTTTIGISAELDDGSVTADNVKVKIGTSSSELSVDSCSGNSCSFTRYDDMIAGKHKFTVLLYNQNDQLIKTTLAYLSVDNIPPVLESFVVSPKGSASGKFNFSYSVSDYAYSLTDSTTCSGIDHIDIYQNDAAKTLIKTVKVDPTSCKHDGITNYQTAISSGNIEVCAKAFDKFGYESAELCDSFSVDAMGPVIGGLSLTLPSGSELGYIKGSTAAVFSTQISEESLDTNKVLADLSSLNKDSSYKSRKADSCEKVDSVYSCKWNIIISMTNSIKAVIKVSAVDTSGNFAESSFSKDIKFDARAPVPTFVSTTQGPYLGDYYLGETASFVVDFTETGIGMSSGEAYLDMTKIGKGTMKANSCQKGLSGWQCFWNDIKVSASHGSDVLIKVSTKTADDLGNKVKVELGRNFEVEKNPPTIMWINVSPIHGAYDLGETLLLGEQAVINVHVKDSSEPTGELDFSNFVSGSSILGSACVQAGIDEWDCSFTTPVIENSGTNSYTVSIYDFNRNKAERTGSILIYTLDSSASPNYFTSKVECSPSAIDREVSSMINQRVYCHVKLTPVKNDAKPISITLHSCSNDRVEAVSNEGTTNNGAAYTSNFKGFSYVQEANLFNAESGGYDPYLKFTFKSTEFNVKDVQFYCALSITGAASGQVTATPEIENVVISIPLYDMPLGQLDDNIQKKIDDAKDSANNGIWKLIGTLRKLFKYAEMICNVVSIITNVVSIMSVLGKVFAGTETLARSYPPAYWAARGQRIAWNSATESFHDGALKTMGLLKKFCLFTNCQMSPAEEDEAGTKKGTFSSKWFNILGGGGGLSSALYGDPNDPTSGGNNELQTYTGINIVRDWTGKEPSSYLNAKNSLVLSTLTFCIPGIIYNLDKYRQIQCMYADCLQTSADSGYPISVCEDQKEYATCKYIYGEIFQIIPFTAVFDYYARLVKNALSDPLNIIGFAIGWACKPQIAGSNEWGHSWCIWPKIIEEVGMVANDIMSIVDGGAWSIQEDYCDKLSTDESEDGAEEEKSGWFS